MGIPTVLRARGGIVTIDQRFDGGDAILQACRDLDVDYVVSSPGSDWGSVWEALGRQELQGRAGPTYLNCGHELLAVDIAAGYTAMTGRMQAVLLHAGVGLLQGAMGLHGARLSELPMLVMSGESTSFGFAQAFEPGAQWYNNHNVAGGLHTLVQPLFKWSHRVGSASILYESVLRAGQIATSLPGGPAYLDIPREGPACRAVEERRPRLRRVSEEARDRQAAAIAAARATARVHPIALCAALGDTLPADTIYVDETKVHLGLNRRHLEHRGAQSYLAMRAGLGQGIGIALGVKLARRERFVACPIGDGAFVYNPVIACFGTARDVKLPLLIVIYNNHGYRAMRDSQLAYYPDGIGARQGLFYGEPIHGIDYEALIRPFGGLGIRVDERAALAPALEQAQRAVADGRTAVVNVHVTDLD
jgi:thiamine pyrophosphate-dependent acetolactate synthase large subunit-like protein